MRCDAMPMHGLRRLHCSGCDFGAQVAGRHVREDAGSGSDVREATSQIETIGTCNYVSLDAGDMAAVFP